MDEYTNSFMDGLTDQALNTVDAERYDDDVAYKDGVDTQRNGTSQSFNHV